MLSWGAQPAGTRAEAHLKCNASSGFLFYCAASQLCILHTDPLTQPGARHFLLSIRTHLRGSLCALYGWKKRTIIPHQAVAVRQHVDCMGKQA